MSRAKILWGVCGIGLGHTFRQLPLIEYFAKEGRLVIFAYGASLKFYSAHFAGNDSVSVERVSVPFYVGGDDGIDFAETARRMQNSPEDTLAINCAAMTRAQSLIGKPDLVVTDYEPVAAQYAYATGAPLVTLDQQSKYLIGDFPDRLGGVGFADEVERLTMFFPAAEARIACSFFAVPPKPGAKHEVSIYPSILKPSIVSMKRKVDPEAILVYVSSQREFVQPLSEAASVFGGHGEHQFHVFLPEVPLERGPANVKYYKHGDPRFANLLSTCAGLITTAGHGLLSEAMFLGIPTYTVPLAVYEQQMNAHIVDAHHFGTAQDTVEKEALSLFLARLSEFSSNIDSDTNVLLRTSGEQQIIARLQGFLD